MFTDDAKHVSLFRIKGANDHWAVYNYRVDVPVGSRGPKDVIDEAVLTGWLPDGGYQPRPRPERPYRYLDIRESAQDARENCVYALHLDAAMGDHRLEFVPGSPFIPLPLNATDEPYFLTDFKVQYGGNGVWASFCCDLKKVRGSKLAERIKKAARAHGHDHVHAHGHDHAPVLTIPFCLNVIDPELEASPWVVPRHSHNFQDVEWSFLTHGGVHPSDVAFLSVEL